MIVDYRKMRTEHAPILIDGAVVEQVGTATAWYGNCLASDRKALQRVVRTAQHIIGAKLPAIQDLYTR